MGDKHQPHNVSTLMEYMVYTDTLERINGSDDTCLVPVCIHIFTALLCCVVLLDGFILFFVLLFCFLLLCQPHYFRTIFFSFSSGQGCKVVNVHFARWNVFIGQRGRVPFCGSKKSGINRFSYYFSRDRQRPDIEIVS